MPWPRGESEQPYDDLAYLPNEVPLIHQPRVLARLRLLQSGFLRNLHAHFYLQCAELCCHNLYIQDPPRQPRESSPPQLYLPVDLQNKFSNRLDINSIILTVPLQHHKASLLLSMSQTRHVFEENKGQ